MKIPLTRKQLLLMLLYTGAIVWIVLILQPISIAHFGDLIDVLFPSGLIALKERQLLFIIQGLMLFIILPVYVLTFYFAWKYSANNPKPSTYDPDLVDNKLAECIWWGFPFVMTAIVCALTWIKTEELDPYKPIVSDKKAIEIQAVALQWKWLFIYPDEGIATLNYLHIPKETPIHFTITADAPMNSLWIPDLSGQIYAMAGMRTELNLIANKTGQSRGSSANISGEGFSGMHFMVYTQEEEEFAKWVKEAATSSSLIDWQTYQKIASPSSDAPRETYKLTDRSLFDQIIGKYMHP